MASSMFAAGAEERFVRPAARWVRPRISKEAALGLAKALALQPLAACVLANRGFTEAAAARDFIHPGIELLHDPFLMRDMDAAVTRIWSAIAAGEQMLLYGDYDADGTASIVVLKKAIEILGGRAEFHIPHRLTEGYGMRAEIVERAAQSGVRLIVSVDTGIRATEAELCAIGGHRCDRDRSSFAGGRTAAGARGFESESPGLRLSGQEPLWGWRDVEAGAGAAGAERSGRGAAGGAARILSEAGGDCDGGRYCSADG